MGDAGIGIAPKAGDGGGPFLVELGDDAARKLARDRPAGSLGHEQEAGHVRRPDVPGHLGGDAAQAVRGAALAGRAGQAGLAVRARRDPAAPLGALIEPGAPSATTSTVSPRPRVRLP